jgi:hypothetical protein
MSCIAWWPVLLVLNTTSNNVSSITYNMVTSFIGVERHFQQSSTPIKLAIMLYVIPDTLLKVAFNTNKTGHHGIRYAWHIIGGGVQHQLNWSPCYTLNLTHCWKYVSSITYNMVTSFIGVERHFQQCVRYKVWHGEQFYLCLMPLSTMCQVYHITSMLYIITDTLLKVVLSKLNGHHVIRYNWHIVESGVKHQ